MLINRGDNMVRIILVLFSFASIFTSCLHGPIGKCTYGKEPVRKGRVVIRSITTDETIHKGYINVSVEGFFRRNFLYTPEYFERCFTAKDYTAGSEIEGIIIPGGPCPPIYRIADCEAR